MEAKKRYVWLAVLVLALVVLWIAFGNTNKDEAMNVPSEEMGALENIEEENMDSENNNSAEVNGEVSAGLESNMTVPPSDVVKEFIVSGDNFSFVPDTIRVRKGDQVKVVFKSTEGFHDFVIDEYGVATKQLKSPSEEVLEFTADKAGTFEYYCSVGTHRQMGMVGTFIVEE